MRNLSTGQRVLLRVRNTVLLVVVLAAILAVAGFSYQAIGQRADSQRFPEIGLRAETARGLQPSPTPCYTKRNHRPCAADPASNYLQQNFLEESNG